MQTHEQELIREAVRHRYAKVATTDSEKNPSPSGDCCASGVQPAPGDSGGCGCGQPGSAKEMATSSASGMGYSVEDLGSVPDGANMGLGCGNPVALASLQAGETVVDLGSGGGFDCFLAAARVGSDGKVIGVDMTAEMVAKARRNARQAGVPNVDFRLGEIEHLPVSDGSADIVISNCVINLSVEKLQVLREAFRVLKPGGRLAISDIVATAPLPPQVQKDLALVSACVGGAATLEDTHAMLESVGFRDIRIEPVQNSRDVIEACAQGSDAADFVTSAYVQAVKPLR